jgi:CMP-N-acetylneuraminate monooxygenase
MFKKLGKLQEEKIISKVEIPIKEITKKINFFNNCIIVKNKNFFKIFDRVCDHAGGRLISRNNKTFCPIHNWEFDPLTGKYINNIKKKEISYEIKKENIIFSIEKSIPKIKTLNPDKESYLKVRYFNHAFLIFEGRKFKFATDPWAIGPAFASGWWLKDKTASDWVEELNNCDFIYISHNHPDHLNSSTLKLCDKKIPIVTPKFQNNSTSSLLKDLNFEKIYEFDFKENINLINTDLVFNFLKSGDFRDDSGIYFSVNKFKCLADVDTNYINFGNFPKVDLYCSSYAGGASGYPLMFDNLELKDKKKKQSLDTKFLFKERLKYLNYTQAKYFLPYAGSFKTKLKRDKFISHNIFKNQISDYKRALKSKVDVLDYEKNDIFYFKNGFLDFQKKLKILKFNDFNEKSFLKDFKKSNSIDMDYIKTYFLNSKFQDNVIIKFELANDNFKNILQTFFVDFTQKKTKFVDMSKYIIDKDTRYINLKIRYDSFMFVIKNMLPWEDLLIGFQCKVFRRPNIYNIKFWSHFSNIYISKKHKRNSKSCNSCELIDNYVDNLIFNQKPNQKLLLNEIDHLKDI